MTTNEKENRLKDALRQTRYAIIGRGGEISETAGLKDLIGAIFNIPADNAITTMTVDGYYFQVPENATKYAYIAAFGGLTYRYANVYYDDATGEYVEKWELENQFPRSIYFNGYDAETGEEFDDEIIIPEEILNLPDYGDGINLEYYNKVDLVNQKYKRCIETIVLDEKSTWGNGVKEGADNNYYVSKIGELGVFVSYNCVSSYFDHAPISSATTGVGIDVFDSSVFGGFAAAIRPENVQDFTLFSFIEWIKANPITLKIARLVPVETDLPVRMNPLLRVWGGKGYIESSPWDGDYYPVEVIVQTRTQ